MNFIESGRETKSIYRHIAGIIFLSFMVKIAYLLFAMMVTGTEADFSVQSYNKLIQRNDSGWYEIIAENGYPEIPAGSVAETQLGSHDKQSEWAFFPFYPAINRLFILWFNTDFSITGLIYSILFSLLAFTGFYMFATAQTGSRNQAYWLTLVLILFPFHYYFSMMYTEAIFLAFLIFSFIAIYKQKIHYIPFLVIPLVLVRPNGIIALIPLYLYFLERNQVLIKYSFRWKALLSREIFVKSLSFLTGPLVFILYGIYQQKMTGYFFAAGVAQAGWYRQFMLPFFSFFRRGDFVTQFNSWYTILFIILGIFSWRKLPLSLNLLIWTGLLVPLFSGSVTSMPRFISVIFPFTLIIGNWIYRLKFRTIILSFLFLAQLLAFYFWLTGHPFSY